MVRIRSGGSPREGLPEFLRYVVVLFSLEIGATALLLGAQVISEYERVGKGETQVNSKPIRTK